MRDLVLLAAAGAAGTLARYFVSGWSLRLFGDRLGWGTLTVNVIGSFVLAFLMQVGLSSDVIPRSARFALTVGFLGAFTTFSTYAYESARYLEDAAWWTAGLNLISNVVLGLLAAIAGLTLGRWYAGGA